MSLRTKKFGTAYCSVDRGGISGAYELYEFKCSCGKPEINCDCIKNKKFIGQKTSEEFKKLNLPTYGEKRFFY
jgi:hypothetical protein